VSDFNCPKCGSDQTAKCSAVYASGTTAIETKTSGMGVGLSRGGFVPVVGGGTTRGVQQTQLAAQLAPPAKEPTVKQFFGGTFFLAPLLGVIVAIVVGLISDWSEPAVVGTFLVVAALIAILNVAATVRMYRENRDEWPKLYAEWERKWYCGRCGETFTPDPNAEPVARSSPATQGASASTMPESGLPGVPITATDEAAHMATPDGPSIAVEELPDTPEELASLIAGNMEGVDLDETLEDERRRRISICGAALARLDLMVAERPELRSTATRLRAEYETKMAAVKKKEKIGRVAGIVSMLVLFGIVVVFMAKGC